MSEPTGTLTRAEARLNRLIGRLLRVGVSVSAAVVLVGAIIYLWHHGAEMVNYGTFRPEPHTLGNVYGFVAQLSALRGRAIIELGLLCLIATPVLYVATALGVYWRQRNRLYVGISSVVLAVLLFSLFFMR